MKLLKIGDHQQRVLHGNPKDGDKSHRRRDGEMGARQKQRQNPPGAGNRNVNQDDHRVQPVLGYRVDQESDQQNGERDDHQESIGGILQLVNLAGPDQMGVVRKLDLLGDLFLRLRDGAAKIALTNREFDGRIATSILAIDRHWPFHLGNRSKLAEWNVVAVGSRDGNLPELLDAAAIRLLPANGQREKLLALEYLSHRLAADRRLYHGVHVTGIETIARADGSIGNDFYVRLAERMEHPKILDAADF